MKKTSDLASHLMLILVVLLFAGTVVWTGYHDKSHNCVIWCNNVPTLYLPIFYNADSLDLYIKKAYLEENNLPAMYVAGTSAYAVRVFDKPALDSLPVIPLEEADMMLLSAAWEGYEPAMIVIEYLDLLKLWHHSIPDHNPKYYAIYPDLKDPDYKLMQFR